MLTLPSLKKIEKKEFIISAFEGLDRRFSAGDKTLSHVQNMSASSLPVLSTRLGRVLLRKTPKSERITGLYAFDNAYFSTYDGSVNRLYYGDEYDNAKCIFTSKEDAMETALICKFDNTICIFNLNNDYEDSMAAGNVGSLKNPEILKAPGFADIMIHDKRIFGCKYNQIWATAVDSYKDWGFDESGNQAEESETAAYSNIFSNKSFFTSCTTYKTHPLFFTEDEIYELRGTNRLNYSLTRIAGFGCVGRNAICEVAGELYFLSKEGVVRYNGSSFSLISDPLRDRPTSYANSVLGGGERTLYVKMKGKRETVLYTYNTETGGWSREDDFPAVCSQRYLGNHYFATADGIYQFEVPYSEKSTGNDGLSFPWEVETQQIHCYLPLRKRSSKLSFYINQDAISKVDVLVSYDSKPFMIVGSVFVSESGAYCIPLPSQDYQSIKIKLRGRGQAQIHYISHSYSTGGCK